MVTTPEEAALEAVEFVKATPIPVGPDPARESVSDTPDLVPPDFEKTADLTVTVGSQIAHFAEDLPADLRPGITNCFLFAQQAADKHIETLAAPTSRDWYSKYIEVMSGTGWSRETATQTLRRIKGTSLQVHKEIVPIITAALGPAAASATAIVNLLNGLEQMQGGKPWIGLFDTCSQRVQANQFQISSATQEGGHPRITLVGFELDAKRSVTQVLFFKLTQDNAELRHFEAKMSFNETVFSAVAPILSARLADRATRFFTETAI